MSLNINDYLFELLLIGVIEIDLFFFFLDREYQIKSLNYWVLSVSSLHENFANS